MFEQAQAGCSESLNELIQRHQGLVHLVVQRQWLLTLPYGDALQAGRRGLWRAILGYDPGRGTTFGTYAYKAIMKYVWAGEGFVVQRLQHGQHAVVQAAEFEDHGGKQSPLVLGEDAGIEGVHIIPVQGDGVLQGRPGQHSPQPGEERREASVHE